MTEVTDASFERDVLERSDQVPVVVDLWAEWCGPCRTLTPILERVVGDTNGTVELVKVNVDQNPRVASTFRVQSIPAVFALKDRQVVDSFIGAQPEATVKQFVSRLASAASEADLLVEAGDEASLRRALELDPDHSGAVVALAEMMVAQGKPDEALALLGRVPETQEVRRVAALARLGDGAPLDRGTDLERHLDELLERVKQDDEARNEFLDLLEAMGPGDPRTAGYRKALTARLF